VIAALCIGFIELTQIIASKLGLSGGVFGWIENQNFGGIGYLLLSGAVTKKVTTPLKCYNNHYTSNQV